MSSEDNDKRSFWQGMAEDWPEDAGRCRAKVKQALDACNPAPQRTWSRGEGEAKMLTVYDLAVALWAIEINESMTHIYHTGERKRKGRKTKQYFKKISRQQWGFSYGQMDAVFKAVTGRACHRAKAAKLFAALIDLNLIRKVGNYSTKRRGNVYETAKPTRDEMMAEANAWIASICSKSDDADAA